MSMRSIILIIFTESIISTILFLVCMKQMLERHNQKQLIDNLNVYNHALLTMYDGIRGIKHDIFNFVQSLNGYVKCNDMQGVSEMVNAIYRECKTISNLEVLKPESIKNPPVYSLLVNKYEDACQNGIIMDINLETDLSQCAIDNYQLCRILGILLDNAIEASKESEEKIINVKFSRVIDGKMIMVENSYKKKDVTLEKLFEKGYSSKEDNQEHGIGLWELRKMIDKSQNLILNTKEDHFFVQELKIENILQPFSLESIDDKILVK